MLPYVREDGMMGCFLLFILLRHYRLLSKERGDDVIGKLKKDGVPYACSWANVTSGLNFSQVIKFQKVSRPATTRKNRSPPTYNADEMNASLATKRLNFINEL